MSFYDFVDFWVVVVHDRVNLASPVLSFKFSLMKDTSVQLFKVGHVLADRTGNQAYFVPKFNQSCSVTCLLRLETVASCKF